MLTRFVRAQLGIFAVLSLLGVSVIAVKYLQLPTMMGVGRIAVTLQLPESGGLYRFANVNYRGVQVGRVEDIELTTQGAEATLSLAGSAKVPADLQVAVRSLSAIGEQYVDLLPSADAPPYLTDGSTIEVSRVRMPQPVGPMLDKVSALLASIPEGKLDKLIDESTAAFDDAGFDLGSLLDSSARIGADSAGVADQLRSLIEDSGVLLDGQVQSADATRTWARSLAGLTEQLRLNDPEVREVLHQAPAALDEVTLLLDQAKPTLPVLLANMASLGQIAVTYRPSLEQLFVLLPPYVSYIQSSGGIQNATGLAPANFRIIVADPPACTVGFLPPSQWRSPADETTIDTPDDLYCKLPQDSPLVVRGARNLPCMGHPGKRAPTVDICDSDRPYEPIAMRQHVLGPYPFDPNLISQGVPPDARIPGEHQSRIEAPVEGTPLPALVPELAPGVTGPPPVPPAPGFADGPTPTDPVGEPPESTNAPPLVGETMPAPGDEQHTAPSGFAGIGPSVEVATYDPRTGGYLTQDGVRLQQNDLVARPSDWRELLLTEGT